MKIADDFCITDLTVDQHCYREYHLCRGNTSKHKNRIGLIEAGNAEFVYLDRRQAVGPGDVIFIPEKLFCYSEWHGAPDIRVVYLSFHIQGDDWGYHIQRLPQPTEPTRQQLRSIAGLLQGDAASRLQAYGRFYGFLAEHLQALTADRRRLDGALYSATDFIADNWNRDIAVADIARACAVSESKLYHLFQQQLGQTPVAYLTAVRVNYAIKYLGEGCYSVGQVCAMTNFHSESYFRRVFKEITGMTPSAYKKGNGK